MKRVAGTPWKDALPKRTQAENVEILLRVADAIAFAHSKGIIHRDLKPENIMLGGFGEVLVMDWGLAIFTDMNRQLGDIKKSPLIVATLGISYFSTWNDTGGKSGWGYSPARCSSEGNE